MMGVIRRLLIGITRHGYGKDEQLQTYLEDVSDNLATVIPDISELRDALNQILQVNSTLVSQRQNDDMKKISGWAAILFAPTLIGAIYGMNFDVMPELSWPLGYPMAIGAMVALAVVLYLVFKKKGLDVSGFRPCLSRRNNSVGSAGAPCRHPGCAGGEASRRRNRGSRVRIRHARSPAVGVSPAC